jgi:hypothetical protein
LKFQNHLYHNCKVELSDNSEYNLSVRDLSNESLNSFKDWQCNAGVDSLFIYANKDIYNGVCMHDKLGNLDTGWELAPAAVICRFDKCGCVSDVLVTKQSPDYSSFQQTKESNT